MSEIGWGWPALSRKAHIFSDGIALCRRWMFTGKLENPFVVTDKAGPDDCAVCWKKAKKLSAGTEPAAGEVGK